MGPLVRHQALIVVVAATVFFTNLGGPRLWDRDEPRNAGCAAEMYAAGDWAVPVFNAELRPHKPVLLYWLQMLAYHVFGVNEFAARFWSALCGIGTALATYHIGRRLFNAEVGLWAALILSSTMIFGVLARAATPDSVLIFFGTLALLVYVVATFRPEDQPDLSPPKRATQPDGYPTSRTTLALMYGLMGLGVLTKGPVGLVLPTAVIGMFLLIVRLPEVPGPGPGASGVWGRVRRLAAALRPFAPGHFLRTCWSMKPVTALAASMAVALPWYLWVGVKTKGAFLEGFFLTHHLHRTLHPMEGHHGPVAYYPIALALGFLPWSAFGMPALIDATRRIRRDDPWKRGLVFVACWVCVYIGVFTLAQTKLPNYIAPAYPAAALITALFVYHLTRGTALVAGLWLRLGLGALALLGLGMLAGLPIAAHFFLPGDEWLGLVGLIPLAGAAACYAYLRKGRVRAATAGFAVMATLLATTLFGWVAARVDAHRTSHVLLSAIQQNAASTPRIASFGCQEPSWIFYARQPIQLLPADGLSRLSDYFAAGTDRFVITTDAIYAHVKAELPEDIVVLEKTPYFLKDENLLVLGKPLRGGRGPVELSSRHVTTR